MILNNNKAKVDHLGRCCTLYNWLWLVQVAIGVRRLTYVDIVVGSLISPEYVVGGCHKKDLKSSSDHNPSIKYLLIFTYFHRFNIDTRDELLFLLYNRKF